LNVASESEFSQVFCRFVVESGKACQRSASATSFLEIRGEHAEYKGSKFGQMDTKAGVNKALDRVRSEQRAMAVHQLFKEC
jgi:hypothetical protein